MSDLFTPYGEKLDPGLPLPEYPRPQLVRGSFLNLNGRWEYALTREAGRPAARDGEIVVPFAPESLLSGVGHVTGPDEFLWYFRTFRLPGDFNIGRVLLHFGGVDQFCTVWVNGQEAGKHDGAYLPFTFDITPYLTEGENELAVKVIDETDTAPFGRGRQRLKHGGLWHTPQSGIWQTVWLESVPEGHIKTLRITPLYDESAVEVYVEGTGEGLTGQVEVFARKTPVAAKLITAGEFVRINLPGAISWSPENPFLYTVRLRLGEDVAASYFGMRKFSRERDEAGRVRFYLNNRPFLLRGVFDQGMYSDGLYTPPSDTAMAGDIAFAKACGFNTIRKHGKIEPLRWYHHCDLAGMLVWQDLPAGGVPGREPKRPVRDDKYRRFGREGAEGRKTFERDMYRAAELLYSTPCLAGWTLFHDGWGQFDARKLAVRMHAASPGRLVDHASGRFDQGGGDVLSAHWAGGAGPLPEGWENDERILMLAAVGGFGFVEPGHFAGGVPHSAGRLPGRKQLMEALESLWRGGLAPLVAAGLSGFMYVQLADAEDEASGLLSYDRRARKVDPQALRALNEGLEP